MVITLYAHPTSTTILRVRYRATSSPPKKKIPDFGHHLRRINSKLDFPALWILEGWVDKVVFPKKFK